jgi:Domain of unknown function (DUF4157)
VTTREFEHPPGPARAPGPPEFGAADRRRTDEAHPLLRLQRAAGNRYVQRAVQQRAVQQRALPAAPARPRAGALRLGPADDPHERAADRMAGQVGRGAVPGRARSSRPAAGADAGGVVLPEVQRAIGQLARSGGQPIPEPVRAPLEQAMGVQFDQVRLHTGGRADELARSLQARAFTTGQDIFFRHGEYQPATGGGQQVLAHELTHVVQQSAGSAGDGLVQRLVGFEFETDWGAHGIADPAQKDRSGQRLQKHTVYKRGQGFTVQVDEASRGFNLPEYAGLKRQIEFVVDPHPESIAGGRTLHHTMLALIAEAKRLNKLRAKRKGGAKSFLYPGTNQNIWIFPDAKVTASPQIHARAQATVGLTLAALYRFAGQTDAESRQTTRTTGWGISHANRGLMLSGQNTDFVHAGAAARDRGLNPRLAGLVTLLASYIKIFHSKSTKPADYVKGYLPILVKTDFAAMFQQLLRKDQDYYQRNPQEFLELVLGVVNDDPAFSVDRREQVLPDALVPEGDSLNLTLQQWLSWIPFGNDYFTRRHDKRLFGIGDLGDGAQQGKKLDKAPGRGQPRTIMEFRGGSLGRGPSGTKGFLTPEEWLEFAFDYYTLIRQLHGRPNPAEWA